MVNWCSGTSLRNIAGALLFRYEHSNHAFHTFCSQKALKVDDQLSNNLFCNAGFRRVQDFHRYFSLFCLFSSNNAKGLATVDIVLDGEEGILNVLWVLGLEVGLLPVLSALAPLGQCCSLYSLEAFPSSSHILKKLVGIGQQCVNRPKYHQSSPLLSPPGSSMHSMRTS